MHYFYIVNVYTKDGDSFLCMSDKPLTAEEVISRCQDKHLFAEQRDAKSAYVDEHAQTEDIVKYKTAYNI